jgi:hypothetical protein
VKRIVLPLVAAIALLVGASGCTPEAESRDAITKWFPDWAEAKAIRVADCESGLNPDAISPGGGNWGLFQLNRTTWEPTARSMGYTWSQVLDPYINSKIALQVYKAAGNSFSPWGCRNA